MEPEELKFEFTVTTAYQDVRLDKVISNAYGNASRVRIQEWIQDRYVHVNGISKKESYRVKEGDVVTITPPPIVECEVQEEDIPLDIRYEDKDVLVINKPRGMVVHPGLGNVSGTLVNALLKYCKEDLSGIGGVKRPGIVHRIDKDTSGLLMIAKNDLTHQSLANQLKEHTVERKYVAIVRGVLIHNTGTIDAPIGRDPIHRQQMAVVKNGKSAITHFSVEKRFREHTLITCSLETGRTHQIRVHMKYIGFPIVGDPVYGIKKDRYPIQGQALHAKVLGFTHPRTKNRVRLTQDLPLDMRNILDELGKRS